MTKFRWFMFGIIFPILTLFANDVDLGKELAKSGDFIKANKLFKKACDDGDAKGCYNLGNSYYEGNGVERDFLKAKELYRKTYNYNQSGMYYIALTREEDVYERFHKNKEGCSRGDLEACGELGFAYDEGFKVAGDKLKAIELFKKSCDGGYGLGCYNLGASYYEGETVAKNYLKAMELFNKSCNLGIKAGCSLINKFKSYNEVFEKYKKACDNGDAEKCFSLGDFYREGKGVEKSFLKASEQYKKACDGGYEEGCFYLGALYYNGGDELIKDRLKAIELFKKACNLGSTDGCSAVKDFNYKTQRFE